MDPAGTHSDKRNQKHLTKIGEGLGGPVEDHLRQETEKQDEAITTIEDVLGDLKVAALVRCASVDSDTCRYTQPCRDPACKQFTIPSRPLR